MLPAIKRATQFGRVQDFEQFPERGVS